jgi:hypothetical protein
MYRARRVSLSSRLSERDRLTHGIQLTLECDVNSHVLDDG